MRESCVETETDRETENMRQTDQTRAYREGQTETERNYSARERDGQRQRLR